MGPSVNMIIPADGAVNQPLTSRVGATFTDQLNGQTVDSSNFTVRPVGGAPLAGWYAVQSGVVNFQPAAPLQSNTTYEVIVRSGGIRDYVGNTVPATFRSLFSTGATVTSIQSRKPTRVMQRRGPTTKAVFESNGKQVETDGRAVERYIK